MPILSLQYFVGPEEAASSNGVPAEKASEGGSQPSLPELPYHRFSNGDGILLVSTLPNGELPKPDPSRVSRFPQGIPALEAGHLTGMQLLTAHSAMPLTLPRPHILCAQITACHAGHGQLCLL